MKTIIIGLSFLTSLSVFAYSPTAGDKLESSIDWERIERGLENGDFSCHGSCASVSVDWKKMWLTLSGQKYRSQKKKDIAYCVLEYQKIKESLDSIAKIEESLEITFAQASILIEMAENSIRSVDLICEDRLGKRKASNLKDSILD